MKSSFIQGKPVTVTVLQWKLCMFIHNKKKRFKKRSFWNELHTKYIVQSENQNVSHRWNFKWYSILSPLGQQFNQRNGMKLLALKRYSKKKENGNHNG